MSLIFNAFLAFGIYSATAVRSAFTRDADARYRLWDRCERRLYAMLTR